MDTNDSAPVARVREALVKAGIEADLVRLGAEVPTAAAAAQALDCAVGQIANSLIFKAGDQPLLVIASGAARVDVAKVGADLGVGRLRRASPEFVLASTGQEVGGVAPVGHPQPVPAVIDEDLAGQGRLWAGGGDEFTMLALTFEQLVDATGGQVRAVR